MPIFSRTPTRFLIVFILCLFGLVSQSHALTIPAPALKEGQTLFITNDYEQNIRYWNSKKEQQFSRKESVFVRSMTFLPKDQHSTDNDEFFLTIPVHKGSTGFRGDGGRKYEDKLLHGVRVNFYIENGEVVLLSPDKDKPLKLTDKQRETVIDIAKGNTYFNTLVKMATSQDYTLNQEVSLDPEFIKKHLTGESGSIKLKALRLMWEKELAEFEVNIKLADMADKAVRDQERTCKLLFWVLTKTGHPVNLSVECVMRGKKDDVQFHSLEYSSRGYSYYGFPISKISPRPTPNLQPNGEIMGMEYSNEMEQLIFLTREADSDTSWLTFWDVHQRKALNVVRPPGDRLHLTDNGKSAYVVSKHRLLKGWIELIDHYEEFGSAVNMDLNRTIIDSDLMGLYPVTLNEKNEIEVWNPGYGKLIFQQALKHSTPELISVSPDQRLVTMSSEGDVYVHKINILTQQCGVKIDESYCENPVVLFTESKDKIHVDLGLAKRHRKKEKAKLKSIQLHPKEPVIIYCSESSEKCGLVNYQTKQHSPIDGTYNVKFTHDNRIFTDSGYHDLTGKPLQGFSRYAFFEPGSALSEKHNLAFNVQRASGQFTDKEIVIQDANNGTIIDTINRQVYPVNSIATFKGHGLVFSTGNPFSNAQANVLDLAQLQLESTTVPGTNVIIDANDEWMFMKSYGLSVLAMFSAKQPPITLQLNVGSHVLLDKYLVYSSEKAIYQLDLSSRKTTKLYEFDSPVHEIVVFDETGKQLAARLNRGVIALPHLDKKMDLPFYGAEAKKSMTFDPKTNSFFVSGLRDNTGFFNDSIEVTQQYATTGEHILTMEPLWQKNHTLTTTTTGQLWSGTQSGEIIIREIKSGLTLEEFPAHKGRITDIKQLDDNTMVSSASDGTVKLWRLDIPNGKFLNSQQPSLLQTVVIKKDIAKRTPKLIATIIVDKEGEYIINTPDGYYWSTPKALHQSSFLNGDTIFDYTQYDFWLNRPDIVLERLGKSNSDTIDHWKKVVSFRKGRYPNKPNRLPIDQTPPTFKISGPDQVVTEQDVTFKYELENKDGSDAILHVLINQIPIYGTKGKSIDKNKGEIKLALTSGINKIKAYIETENGLQSESQFLTYNKPNTGKLPDLYLLSIGVSDYKLETVPDLNYAAKDAKDLQTLFANSKQFDKVHSKTILNTEVTADNVKTAKTFLEQARPSDRVIVFFAGHGLLDSDNNYFFATTDIDPNEPAVKGLAYSDITDLLDGIPSRHKLLMLDTCHSGEAIETASADIKLPEGVKARGIRIQRDKKIDKNSLNLSFELLQKTFVDLRSATGTIVISASGGQEFAEENNIVKNGVFTASVIRGLGEKAADANKDGHVSITELRAFTYREVSRLTDGEQKPTTRQNNLDIDFTLF